MSDNSNKFSTLLENSILIGDGAMGTMLQLSGYTEAPDSLNLDEAAKSVIVDIHKSYLEAGSDIIQTNTFGSNPMKLKSYRLEAEIEKINKNAVDIVKEAINTYRSEQNPERDLFIAGDIGPLSVLLEPMGTTTYKEAVKLFSEQMAILLENGVDFLLIETIMDLNEALAAVEAAKSFQPVIPVVCTMTFNEKGVTIMGNRAEDCVKALIENGCDAVGANCSVGSDSMVLIAEKIRAASPDAKLMFQPNAGMPQLKDGQTVYNETPEIMAANIKRILEYKPSIIGTCCGSTPEHISKISQLVK